MAYYPLTTARNALNIHEQSPAINFQRLLDKVAEHGKKKPAGGLAPGPGL
jgi:hypothetical protein